MRNYLKWTLPFMGLLLALAVLFRMVDLRQVMAAIASADPVWILAAVMAILFAPLWVAAKVWCLVRVAGEPRSLRRCWSAVLAAVALNSVIPGRGGDLVRAVFLTDQPGTTGLFLGVVLLERLIDVFTLGLVALAASWSAGLSIATVVAFGASTAAVGVMVLLSLGHKLPFKQQLAEQIGRTARGMRAKPGLSAAAVGLSALAWLNNVLVMFLALQALRVAVPFAAVARSTPIAILAGIVPVSVSGIGTRDTAFVLLLGDYAAANVIAAASFIYTALTMWLLALFGLGALGTETLRRTRAEVAKEQG